MLTDTEWPDERALEAEIQRRIPNYRNASPLVWQQMSPLTSKIRADLAGRLGIPASHFKSDIYLGHIGERRVLIFLAGAANPLSRGETFFEAAWWWRSAYKDLARRRAHVMIVIPNSQDSVRDHFDLAQVTAAVIASTSAIGVIWESADAIYRAKRFLDDMNRAGARMPAELAVSVKLGRDTEFPRKDGRESWLAMTYGVSAMGLKEIEFRGFDGQPHELIQLLWNTSAYLMKNGDVIKHNDTIGSRNK